MGNYQGQKWLLLSTMARTTKDLNDGQKHQCRKLLPLLTMVKITNAENIPFALNDGGGKYQGQ
jgi:hypothetical protein